MNSPSFLTLFIRTIGSSIAALLMTIVYSVLSARLLGADGRGTLAAIQLWPTVLAGSMTVGLQTAFVYYARQDRSRCAQFFAAGLCATFLVSILSAIVGWRLLSHALPFLSTAQLHFAKIYLAFMLPVVSVSIYIGGCAQLIEDLRLFNVLKIVPIAFQVIAIISLYLSVGITPERLAIGTVVTQLLALSWSTREATKSLGFSLKQTRVHILMLCGYGASVWAVEVLGVATQQIDKIWISGALSLRELGVYTLAFGMSRVVANIQNSAATILFPRNIGKPKGEVVSSTAKVFRLTFWATLVVAIPASLLAIPLFPLVFGPDFAASGWMFPLLVLECILGTSSWVLAQAFNSLGKPHLIVTRQISGLLCMVTVAYFLVPRIGVWGVVLAMLTGALVRLVVTLLAFPKGLKVPMPQIFLDKNDIQGVFIILKKKFVSVT